MVFFFSVAVNGVEHAKHHARIHSQVCSFIRAMVLMNARCRRPQCVLMCPLSMDCTIEVTIDNINGIYYDHVKA